MNIVSKSDPLKLLAKLTDWFIIWDKDNYGEWKFDSLDSQFSFSENQGFWWDPSKRIFAISWYNVKNPLQTIPRVCDKDQRHCKLLQIIIKVWGKSGLWKAQ